jgi:hypothetical protein
MFSRIFPHNGQNMPEAVLDEPHGPVIGVAGTSEAWWKARTPA